MSIPFALSPISIIFMVIDYIDYIIVSGFFLSINDQAYFAINTLVRQPSEENLMWMKVIDRLTNDCFPKFVFQVGGVPDRVKREGLCFKVR